MHQTSDLNVNNFTCPFMIAFGTVNDWNRLGWGTNLPEQTGEEKMSLVTRVGLPGNAEEDACEPPRVPAQVFWLPLLCRMRPNLGTREYNNDSFIEASVA